MLSEEKINAIEEAVYCKTIQKGKTQHVYLTQFARAIEAAVLAELAKAAILNAEYTRGRNDGWEAAMLKVAEQAKAGPVAWLDLEKLNRAGMAYATSFESNGRQTALYLHHAPAPEGMVPVPREPTEAMYAAVDNERLAQAYWRKLIAAAEKEQSNAG